MALDRIWEAVVNAPRAQVGCRIILLIAGNGCLLRQDTAHASDNFGCLARLSCLSQLAQALPATGYPKIPSFSAAPLVSIVRYDLIHLFSLEIPPPLGQMVVLLRLV